MDAKIKKRKWNKEERGIIKEGKQYLIDKKFKKAAEYFRKKLEGTKNQPFSPELRNLLLCLLGYIYYRNENYKDCFESLYTSISEYPNLDKIYEFVPLLLNQKIKENSLSCIEKSFKKKDNFAAHVIISILDYLMSNFEGMEKHLKRAIDFNPENLYLSYYLAECYKFKFEYKKALKLYNKFYSIKPEISIDYYLNKSECYYSLALDYWRQGDTITARKFLEDIIELSHDVRGKLKKGGKRGESFLRTVNAFEKEDILFFEILLFDSLFPKIFECKTLSALHFSLFKISEFMENLSMSKTVEKLRKRQKQGIWEFPIPLAVGVTKSYCVNLLLLVFEGRFFCERFKKESLKDDILKRDILQLEKSRKMLLDLRFIKGKQAIDAVENFVSEMLNLTKEEILSREPELINLLKPAYVLGEELSQHMAEKGLKEGSFQSLKDFILQEGEKTKTAIFGKIEDSLGSSKKEITGRKPEEKEPKMEKAKYIIFLSHTSGIGIVKKEEIEKSIQKDYLKDKVKYDIFIYGRTVYKKIKNKIGTKIEQNIVPIDLDENVFNLLLIFLIYKDKPIFALPLYNKAWEGSPEYKDVESAVQIMNDLKQTVSQLRLSFEDIEGFDIPRARGRRDKRGGTYFLRGKFKFCLIIEKSSINNYILPGEQ